MRVSAVPLSTNSPKGYDIQYDSFSTKSDLHKKIRNWFDGLDRETRDTDLPVFIPR